MYEKEDLDAVIISVSPQQHPDRVCEALAHGLHLFLEKPPAMRVAEVERMLAQRKDHVVVGFKKVFMTAAQKAYELIGSAHYGHLKSILTMYPISIPENGEEILARRTFTNWLGNGCHPLSLMMAAGGKVAAVTTHRSGEGFGSVILEYESGIIGNLHLASGPNPSKNIIFTGTHGTWQSRTTSGGCCSAASRSIMPTPGILRPRATNPGRWCGGRKTVCLR